MKVYAEIGLEAGQVKALLESHELILRGTIRRRFPKAAIAGVTVDGAALGFGCNGEKVGLHLGSRLAEAWAKTIAMAQASLRAKLGLDQGVKAMLVGECDDPVLARHWKAF